MPDDYKDLGAPKMLTRKTPIRRFFNNEYWRRHFRRRRRRRRRTRGPGEGPDKASFANVSEFQFLHSPNFWPSDKEVWQAPVTTYHSGFPTAPETALGPPVLPRQQFFSLQLVYWFSSACGISRASFRRKLLAGGIIPGTSGELFH